MAEEAIFIKTEDTILLKKALAKKLYSKNIDQPEISEILNLSQPMVSNYCGSNEKIPKKILDLAENISDKIINGQSIKFHTGISFSDRTIEGRFFIANKNEIITDENSKIIDNLTKAFFLLKDKDIGGLIPEVKINIAMAKEISEGPEDVASFLNGLIVIDDKITSYNGIRFGRSKHLSSLLLDLKKTFENVNAVMNIAYNKQLKNTSFCTGYLTKDYKLKNNKKQFDILLHRGDFGIEPCAYVLGKDAVDVSKKVLKIIEDIKNEK